MQPALFSSLFSNGADDVDAGRKQVTSCPARVDADIGFLPKHDNSHIPPLTGSDYFITGGRPIPSSLSSFGTSPMAPAPLFGARDGNFIFPTGKEKAIANMYNCLSCQGRGTRDLCYTPTIEAGTNEHIMSISAKPGASHLSVEELRWQYGQAHKIEPLKQALSFGGSASGDNSNNKGPVPGAPYPLWGSGFGPSNGSASKGIAHSGEQGKSQAPIFTFPPHVFSPLGGPGSDSSTPDALPTPLLGFPGTKPGNNSLFDNAPPTPSFGSSFTKPSNNSLFDKAPPTPSFGSPFTKPSNNSLFDKAPPTPSFGSPFTKPSNNSLFDKAPPTPSFGSPFTKPSNNSLFDKAPPTPSFGSSFTKPSNNSLFDKAPPTPSFGSSFTKPSNNILFDKATPTPSLGSPGTKRSNTGLFDKAPPTPSFGSSFTKPSNNSLFDKAPPTPSFGSSFTKPSNNSLFDKAPPTPSFGSSFTKPSNNILFDKATPTPSLGSPGTKRSNTGLFDKAPPTPSFGSSFTKPSNNILFDKATPTPSLGSPGTKRSNTGLFDTPGWFIPIDCSTNPATPMDHLPGFPPAQTSQTAPPSPFTFKPATERDAGKHMFSTATETHVGNSWRCKYCGRQAPQEKHGPFDKHVPVPTTVQAPSQSQQGDYLFRSKISGEDAERVGEGSRMAPSSLLPAIPVIILPVIPTNGSFGAVPGNAGPGNSPGSYVFPGTTIPPFIVPHNLLATQTASGENAMPFVYMQPVPFAAVNSLAQNAQSHAHADGSRAPWVRRQ